MAQGGKRAGAGRKKGSRNKRTIEVRDFLDGIGCNPIKLQADVAMGKPVTCRPEGSPLDAKPVKTYPTLDQMITCRRSLSEYYAPKLKAIEHSGSVGSHEASLEELDGQDAD